MNNSPAQFGTLSPDDQARFDAVLQAHNYTPPAQQGQPTGTQNWRTLVNTSAQTSPTNSLGATVGHSIVDTAKSGIDNVKSGFSDIFNPSATSQQVGADLAHASLPVKAAGAVASAAQTGAHTVAGLGKIVGGIGQTALSPIVGPASAAGSAIGHQIGNAVPSHAAQQFSDTLDKHPEIGQTASDVMNISNLAIPDVAEKAGPALDAVGNEAKNIASDVATKVAPSPKPTAPKAPSVADTAKAHEAIDAEIRNTAAKYPSVGRVLNQAEVTKKSDPVSVLSSYSGGRALPTLTKGKLQVDTATQFLNSQVKRLADIKNDLVATGKKLTPVKDFQTRANAIIDSQSGWSEAKKATAKNDVTNITATWQKIYPDGIPNKELDALKTEHTNESTSYNSKSPFSLDAHAIVGKAARQLVEKNAGDAPIGELNKLISSHYDAVDLLNSMRGKTPHGGAMSKMFNNTIGEVGGLAGGMAVGHPFLGAMAGRAGAEAVNEIINNHFISNPLKRSLVNNMKGADPAVVQKALDYLNPDSQTRTSETTVNTSSEDFTPKSKTGQYLQNNPLSMGLSTKAVAPKIPEDDLATMSDFTDYTAGSYKPSLEEAHKLELDASRIWERYLPGKNMPKSPQGIANEFGRILEAAKFGKK